MENKIVDSGVKTKANSLKSTESDLSIITKFRKIAKKLISENHNSDKDTFYRKTANDIVYNEKSHVVAVFKDFLIYDDTSEFLKRFYKSNESSFRLPKYLEYYEQNSKIFPNYINLPESKFLYRNIKRKQRMIDNIQKYETEKKRKKENDETMIFNTQIVDYIINQTSICDSQTNITLNNSFAKHFSNKNVLSPNRFSDLNLKEKFNQNQNCNKQLQKEENLQTEKNEKENFCFNNNNNNKNQKLNLNANERNKENKENRNINTTNNNHNNNINSLIASNKNKNNDLEIFSNFEKLNNNAKLKNTISFLNREAKSKSNETRDLSANKNLKKKSFNNDNQNVEKSFVSMQCLIEAIDQAEKTVAKVPLTYRESERYFDDFKQKDEFEEIQNTKNEMNSYRETNTLKLNKDANENIHLNDESAIKNKNEKQQHNNYFKELTNDNKKGKLNSKSNQDQIKSDEKDNKKVFNSSNKKDELLNANANAKKSSVAESQSKSPNSNSNTNNNHTNFNVNIKANNKTNLFSEILLLEKLRKNQTNLAAKDSLIINNANKSSKNFNNSNNTNNTNCKEADVKISKKNSFSLKLKENNKIENASTFNTAADACSSNLTVKEAKYMTRNEIILSNLLSKHSLNKQKDSVSSQALKASGIQVTKNKNKNKENVSIEKKNLNSKEANIMLAANENPVLSKNNNNNNHENNKNNSFIKSDKKNNSIKNNKNNYLFNNNNKSDLEIALNPEQKLNNEKKNIISKKIEKEEIHQRNVSRNKLDFNCISSIINNNSKPASDYNYTKNLLNSQADLKAKDTLQNLALTGESFKPQVNSMKKKFLNSQQEKESELLIQKLNSHRTIQNKKVNSGNFNTNINILNSNFSNSSKMNSTQVFFNKTNFELNSKPKVKSHRVSPSYGVPQQQKKENNNVNARNNNFKLNMNSPNLILSNKIHNNIKNPNKINSNDNINKNSKNIYNNNNNAVNAHSSYLNNNNTNNNSNFSNLTNKENNFNFQNLISSNNQNFTTTTTTNNEITKNIINNKNNNSNNKPNFNTNSINSHRDFIINQNSSSSNTKFNLSNLNESIKKQTFLKEENESLVNAVNVGMHKNGKLIVKGSNNFAKEEIHIGSYRSKDKQRSCKSNFNCANTFNTHNINTARELTHQTKSGFSLLNSENNSLINNNNPKTNFTNNNLNNNKNINQMKNANSINTKKTLFSPIFNPATKFIANMSPRHPTPVKDLVEIKLAHKISAINEKEKEFYNSSLINDANINTNSLDICTSNAHNDINNNDPLFSRKNSKTKLLNTSNNPNNVDNNNANNINNINNNKKTQIKISSQITNAAANSENFSSSGGKTEKKGNFLYNIIGNSIKPHEAEFKILSARLSRRGSEASSSLGRIRDPNAKIIENLFAKNSIKEPHKIFFNSKVKLDNNNTISNSNNCNYKNANSQVNLFQNSNSYGNLFFNASNASIKIGATARKSKIINSGNSYNYNNNKNNFNTNSASKNLGNSIIGNFNQAKNLEINFATLNNNNNNNINNNLNSNNNNNLVANSLGNHLQKSSVCNNANSSKIKGIQIKNFNQAVLNNFTAAKACYNNSDRTVKSNKKV